MIWWVSTRSLRVRISLVGGFLLALALVAFFRPLRSAFTEWRAERLVEEALRFAEAGNWAEMQRTATASLQLCHSIEGIRVLLSATEKTGDRRHLKLAVALFGHPGAGVEDRVRALRIFLDHRDLLLAAPLVQSLPAEERDDPAMRSQIVRLLLMDQNYGEALAIVDGLPENQRDPHLDLQIARAFAQSGNEEVRLATAIRIMRVLEGPDREAALAALRLLASLPDKWIHKGAAEKTLQRFGEDESLAMEDWLSLQLLRIGLRKVDREEAMDAAVNACREGHLEELLGWLERLGEAEQIVELTDLPALGETPPAGVFEFRLRALEALRRYDKLEIELRDPPVTVREIALQCSRASLADKRGNRSRALLLWSEALKQAERDPNRNWYFLISTMAGRAGERDLSMEALACGIEHRLGIPPRTSELESLFAWLHERNDTKRLLSLSYRLLQREPGNPLLINNYHFLRIMHGDGTDHDVRALRNLVQLFPGAPEYAGSLAFALLTRDQPREALDVLEALEGDQRPRSEPALRAAALTALGRADEADAISTEIVWEEISPEEARVLKEIASR